MGTEATTAAHAGTPQPEGGRGARDPWAGAALAVGAALGAALFAPDAWPSGPGRVEVGYRGASSVAEARVGIERPQELTLQTPDGRIHVAFPTGLPTDSVVEAKVRLVRDGRPGRPDPREVSLRLVLPDGRVEPIPVLSCDEEARALLASRRPPVGAGTVLALLACVIVLWVTEAVPLFATALLVPVVLAVSRVAEPEAALAPVFDPVIALFFGGFLMAEAMRRVGLDRFAAVEIVVRAGRSPAALFAAMIALSAFLSMWMSNTAAAAVVIPIALAVTEPLGSPGYRRAAVLGIAYAATIGGVGSLVGTPANPLAVRFLAAFAGRDLGFVDWFGFGLPVLAAFLPTMGLYLWFRMGARVDPARFAAAREAARRERGTVGGLTRDRRTVLAVFAGVALAWVTEPWHGLDPGIVAVAGALTLAVLGRVIAADLGRIAWDALITFGGGLTLGMSLVASGVADWLASRLSGLAGVPPPLALTAVATLTLALTAVASNTASAAMLVPFAIPLAAVIGVDPVLLVVVVAIASSVDFALVIGTPPTMLAYATRMYTVGEILRTGIPLDAIGILILVTLGVAAWRVLGLV